jgi:hypothetical protein
MITFVGAWCRFLNGPTVKRKVSYPRTNGSELMRFLFAPCYAKYRFGTYKESRNFITATRSGKATPARFLNYNWSIGSLFDAQTPQNY